MRPDCRIKLLRGIVFAAAGLLTALVLPCDAQPNVPTNGVPEVIQNAVVQEFPIEVNGHSMTIRVLSPQPEHLATNPALLFSFAMDRTTSISSRPYCLPAEHFLSQGHRAASFDLPAHGERIDAFGSDIAGMRNAFVAGKDPFAAFVEEGKAAVSECIKRGLATPGRIAVGGTSRGGYMALRLLAGDDRIAAGAGFAPVTDWRALREFAADKERDDVANLKLDNVVKGMTGKHVYVAIGSADDRVSTDCCKAFIDALTKSNAGAGKGSGLIDFNLTGDPGHQCSDPWYEKGRQFLLNSVIASH